MNWVRWKWVRCPGEWTAGRETHARRSGGLVGVRSEPESLPRTPGPEGRGAADPDPEGEARRHHGVVGRSRSGSRSARERRPEPGSSGDLVAGDHDLGSL